MSDAILRKNSGDILASNLMPITCRCVVRIGHGFVTADAPTDFSDVTLYASQDERYSEATIDSPIWLGADDIRHVMARYPELDSDLDSDSDLDGEVVEKPSEPSKSEPPEHGKPGHEEAKKPSEPEHDKPEHKEAKKPTSQKGKT
jgi:hypothetical protein